MTTTSRVRGNIIVYGLLACLLPAALATAQDINADFAEGVRLFQERSFRPAVDRLEEVVQDQPDNEAAWYYLGVARIDLGDLEDALQALQRAQELRPGRPGISLNIGRVYERLGAWDQAIHAYQDELRRVAEGDSLALDEVDPHGGGIQQNVHQVVVQQVDLVDI